jgi:hypothetical protein
MDSHDTSPDTIGPHSCIQAGWFQTCDKDKTRTDNGTDRRPYCDDLSSSLGEGCLSIEARAVNCWPHSATWRR